MTQHSQLKQSYEITQWTREQKWSLLQDTHIFPKKTSPVHATYSFSPITGINYAVLVLSWSTAQIISLLTALLYLKQNEFYWYYSLLKCSLFSHMLQREKYLASEQNWQSRTSTYKHSNMTSYDIWLSINIQCKEYDTNKDKQNCYFALIITTINYPGSQAVQWQCLNKTDLPILGGLP